MPNTTPAIDPFWSGVIGAAGGLVGTAGNAIWQGAMNKKTRKWNEKMYYQQRTDALSDWNRQNEYNSPAQVMARFKDAKLNPNLIYGQGNEGGTIRSSSVEGWKPQTSDIQSPLAQMFMMMYDLAKTSQETQNLKAQEELTKVSAARGNIEKDRSQLQYDTESVLYGTTLRKAHAEAYAAELQNQISESKLTQVLNDTEISTATKQTAIKTVLEKYNQILLDQAQTRAATAKTSEETKKVTQEVENLKAMGEILKSDKVIRQIEQQLAERGIFRGDNAVFRAIQGIMTEIMSKIAESAKKR